jgi:hypothetical protein
VPEFGEDPLKEFNQMLEIEKKDENLVRQEIKNEKSGSSLMS